MKPLIEIGKNYLVNTDEFFYAPDGQIYQAVWGEAKGIYEAEETLGISKVRGAGWFIEVGNMMIAGCKAHYVMRCDTCSFEPAIDSNTGEPFPVSRIYNANQATTRTFKNNQLYTVRQQVFHPEYVTLRHIDGRWFDEDVPGGLETTLSNSNIEAAWELI